MHLNYHSNFFFFWLCRDSGAFFFLQSCLQAVDVVQKRVLASLWWRCRTSGSSLTYAALLCLCKELILISRAGACRHWECACVQCLAVCVRTRLPLLIIHLVAHTLLSLLPCCIHKLRPVERLEAASRRQKSSGTLAIQGSRKCTHSFGTISTERGPRLTN